MECKYCVNGAVIHCRDAVDQLNILMEAALGARGEGLKGKETEGVRERCIVTLIEVI